MNFQPRQDLNQELTPTRGAVSIIHRNFTQEINGVWYFAIWLLHLRLVTSSFGIAIFEIQGFKVRKNRTCTFYYICIFVRYFYPKQHWYHITSLKLALRFVLAIYCVHYDLKKRVLWQFLRNGITVFTMALHGFEKQQKVCI